MNPIPVLTVTQIAERWQCDRRTVVAHIYKGQLSAFRLGRNWRVLLVEIERFEKAQAAA